MTLAEQTKPQQSIPNINHSPLSSGFGPLLHIHVFLYLKKIKSVYFKINMHITLGGPPSWHSGKESTCQCREHAFNPWVGKVPWRREWPPTPVFVLGESHGQRSQSGYSPWGRIESDRTEQLSEHACAHTSLSWKEGDRKHAGNTRQRGTVSRKASPGGASSLGFKKGG